MSDRLDLPEQAPKAGEVWLDKVRNLRGGRCRTLVLRTFHEPAEGTEWESEMWVEHTSPGGNYRSKASDFVRDNEREVSAKMRTCVRHNVAGCKQCGMFSGFVAALEPRVIREMVLGNVFEHGRVMFGCGLCGAILPNPVDTEPGISPVVDLVERHRAWHDRLERLLEGRS